MYIHLIPYQIFPQTKCAGILGDPLVNITFGAGANPGAPFMAVKSSYTFVGNDCPSDDTYTIINSSKGCFYGDWHTITQDHTGDVNGYFLLLNSSFRPNNFYIDTIKNLCASTTYQFGVWLLNMDLPTSCGNGGARPNIIVRIEKTDGTLIDSFTTNNIEPTSVPLWQQFTFNIATTETSLVVKMANKNFGGCGGDFAVDDITFRPCIADLKTNTSATSKLITAMYHCESKDTVFTFTNKFYNIYKNVAYSWQSSVDSGRNWVNITNANTDSLTQYFPATKNTLLHLYRLNVGEKENINFSKCTSQSNVDSVVTVLEPIPILSSNSPICEGNTLILNASDGYSYTWLEPSGISVIGNRIDLDSVQPNKSGKYIVNVTSEYGCSTMDSLFVTVNPKPKAFAGTNVKICEGIRIQLTGTGGGTYSWMPATGLSNSSISNPYARPVDTTRYTLLVTNMFNCIDTASVVVDVVHIPIAKAGNNKDVAAGGSVKLDGMVSGFDFSYYWTPNTDISNALLIQPLVNPINNTVYTLHAVSNQGCGSSTDDVTVTVIKTIEIPNVFSPNNDGINDTWVIKNIGVYSLADVTVFNRYGQKVFVSRGYNTPWNGTYNSVPLPIGTYYYVINLNSSNLNFQGSITILR